MTQPVGNQQVSTRICLVCNSNEWLSLPNPTDHQSITTAGTFVNEPLGKSQCKGCGFVQRTECPYLGLTDFYEHHYTNYYERPGTGTFNKVRYREIANWVSSAIGQFVPNSIVEVGCGRGWTMQEMRNIYPTASIEGIEPSIANSEVAREKGFKVYTSKLEPGNVPNRRFDLVFSNHVLQHTTDPVDFLRALGEIANDGGLIVLTVQDASTPTNEIMYCDQNFSFMPNHLVRIAQRAGLSVISWCKAPDIDGLLFSQLIICAKDDPEIWDEISLKSDPIPQVDESSLVYVYRNRCEYIQAWSEINDFLCWKTDKNQRIYNFGAGMFSYLLACYCEDYWERVTACTIDDFAGQFLDKEVIPFRNVNFQEADCLVLGTRPVIQRILLSRFIELPMEIVCWDNFLDG